jgi:glycosyltransferase involved in cell wall biosynthesis
MIPEITIIVPAYNAAQYLRDSISSVLQQTLKEWELIIVNDGSTDNTTEVLEGFLHDARIRVINQPNKGVSAARNAGIDAAKGNYIGFLDADDYFMPGNLQQKFNVLDKNRMIDFVYSDVIHCDGALNELYIQRGINGKNLFEEALLWRKEVIPTLPSNIIGKASLFKENVRFDENLSNCADRFMKIKLAITAVAIYLPEALVKYRNTPNSMSKSVALLEHDEKYIISKIIGDNILPAGLFRRKVIANIYFTISGSWYKDSKKPIRAIRYFFKGFMASPLFISIKVLQKISKIIGFSGKD